MRTLLLVALVLAAPIASAAPDFLLLMGRINVDERVAGLLQTCSDSVDGVVELEHQDGRPIATVQIVADSDCGPSPPAFQAVREPWGWRLGDGVTSTGELRPDPTMSHATLRYEHSPCDPLLGCRVRTTNTWSGTVPIVAYA